MILPEFVDSSLEINAVRYVLVESSDESSSAYTLLTIGFANSFSGDNIDWKDDIGSEVSRRCHVALERGHWVLRDGTGRIIDFH